MRLDIPDDKTLAFTCTLPIRWGDMDAMGHVNNTVYFRYMESARIAWLESLNLPANRDGLGPVIINAFCNFIRQFEYPGEVVARLFVAGIGHTSFDTYTLMSRSDDPDTVCASGGSRIVWVDFPRQKSVPLPDALREHLLRLRAPQQ